jgi:hypothetical protein
MSAKTQGEGHRERAVFESAGESGAGDMLHHQEDGRAVLADVVECADVRMRDARDRPRFLPEALDPAARRGHELARQDLDGDDSIQSRIAGPVDFAHPPRAERGQDLEGAEAGAGIEPHWDF